GKTTLLGMMTAQNTTTSGSITYGGEKVWENEKALAEMCFSRELSPMVMLGQNTMKAKEYLRMASIYFPYWDKEYAARLIEEFGLDVKQKICKMSKGQMSMVTIVVALASRAPITMLDEPVAGLDVVMRDKFYQLLLQDYAETQRTFILSTHIIEEAAGLLEEVLVLHDGVIKEKVNTEELIGQFRYVSGKEEDVNALCGRFEKVHEEGLGRMRAVCLRGADGEIEKAAEGLSVDIAHVPLSKIFVYLTGGETAVQAGVKMNG
ncbi:MAG: ATP-binding cassette domain-containing protein, partial [Oscillospiraceae bacterium]|nr:ATP-binding cassette domain-containing protein [Oscillospiraceae bacterium]